MTEKLKWVGVKMSENILQAFLQTLGVHLKKRKLVQLIRLLNEYFYRLYYTGIIE